MAEEEAKKVVEHETPAPELVEVTDDVHEEKPVIPPPPAEEYCEAPPLLMSQKAQRRRNLLRAQYRTKTDAALESVATEKRSSTFIQSMGRKHEI